MSQQVIKKTQEMLGKYVTKPPLSEKLLGKPPFRYLHDILNVVIKEHGFLVGLFTDQELSSDNIKDKEAKIAFLQKWIDATNIALGENLNVRPSKIVAGHEVDNTNLLLQAVAKGLEKKIDSSEAVKKVLSQQNGSKKEKPKSDSKKEKTSKPKPKAPTGAKDLPVKQTIGSKAPQRNNPDEKKRPSVSKSVAKENIIKKEPKVPDKSKVREKKETIKPKPKDGKSEKEKKEKQDVKTKPTKIKAFEPAKPSKVAPPSNTNKENAPPERDPEPEEIPEPDIIISEEIPTSIFPNSTARPKSELAKIGMANENLFSENNQAEPADSGVGSLESPKDAGKSESLPNVAEPKAPSPVPVPIPPTPGPRPPTLKAYHPDLQEDDFTNAEMVRQTEDPPERPKTGMSIRPRTGRKSARPPSARPAPPKVRERRDIPQEEIPRPPTGKSIPNVILDSDTKEEDDEDENFTVGSSQPIIDEETLIENAKDPNLEKNKQELLKGDQDAKGILVAQILETKKELEDNRREAFSPETPGHRRVPLEQTFQGDASRRKEKELIQKDVEKLTSSIQALTRSVNPLAKMLDYLQEDFDSMQKELESWRNENKTLTQSLKAEQSLTDQQLEPLNIQLQEMDSAIFEQHDRISAIKAIILRNDERISRLLGGINIKS